MRAATDTTAMIDFLAIAFSLPNAPLNLGKPDSFLRNESSRSGLNLGSVAVLRRGRRVLRRVVGSPIFRIHPIAQRAIADLITRRRHLHYKNTESRTRHAGMQAADHGGSIEFAQFGVMQALARNEERVFDSSRKTATCGPITQTGLIC